MPNELDRPTPAAIVADWESKLDLVKRVCCGGRLPPDDSFELFLHVARRTGLDPLLKEIWLTPPRGQGPWQIMAARDGYLAAGHRSGLFAGMQTAVYPEDAAKDPTHATCKVWRKDWTEPVIITVAFREYNTGQSTWAKMPRTMIGKVAEAHALRRAFSLHGTFIQEEMDQADTRPATARVEAPGSVLSGATVTQTQRALPAPPTQPSGDIYGGEFPDDAASPSEAEPVDLEALNQEAEYLIGQTFDEKDRERALKHWGKVRGLAETALAKIETLRARVGKLITPAQLQKLCAMQSERGIDEDQMRAGLMREFGVESRKSLTSAQASRAIESMEPQPEDVR